MAVRLCTDCGTPLAENAAGCNQCGRNLVAERAIARTISLAVVLVIAGAIVAGILWFLRPA